MPLQIDNASKRRALFLHRLAEAKERLAESIKDFDETTICNEPVTGDWTIKDLLGHIVSWNEEFRDSIEMILRGEHPGYDHLILGQDNFSDWNHRQITAKRSYPLSRLLAEVERDYQEALALIERLQADDYLKRGVTPWMEAALKRPTELTKDDTESVETLVSYHWRHMHQHIREIEVWRKDNQ
jgi:hypothetical protein